MSIRRIKRKVREHKNKIFVALGLIVVIALVAFLLTARNMTPLRQTYEITEVDVLDIKGIQGDQVTLKGIKLGDTQQKTLDAIGYPDTQTVYAPDITNMEFGNAFGLNESAVILQFQGDSLVKMTFIPKFNELLMGKTKVNYTKDEFLITFGKPAQVQQLPISQGSPLVMRIYSYKEGIQFATRRGEQIALSFVMPKIITGP